MKKSLILVILGLLVFGVIAGWFISRQQKAADDLTAWTLKGLTESGTNIGGQLRDTSTASALVDSSRPIRLAVGNLDIPNGINGREVADLILVELGSDPKIELVEHAALDATLRELELSLAMLSRSDQLMKVGRMLRADWFLIGSSTQADGTNACLARIVDARSGVVRDLTVVKTGGKATASIVEGLSHFVRQARNAASSRRQKTFLAIGGFEDLSVNRRQAGFADQLKTYLATAFHDSEVVMLERDIVNTLLQEQRLSLAGITESSPPPQMQSAFWLVDGFYQSFENAEMQVDLVLRIEKMFSGRWMQSLRGVPGKPFFKTAKVKIDEMMRSSQAETPLVTFRHRSEINAQMERGVERLRLNRLQLNQDDLYLLLLDRSGIGGYNIGENPERLKNIAEAVRAFETVLLLDPENAEAKLYLAKCLSDPEVHRTEDARNYFREVMATATREKNRFLGQYGLADSYLGGNFRSKAFVDYSKASELFEAYARGATNAGYRARYQQGREAALRQLKPSDLSSRSGVISGLEQKLSKQLEGFLNTARKSGDVPAQGEFNALVKVWSASDPSEGQELVALVRRLQQAFPELSPYIVSRALPLAKGTNAPVVAEFRKSLATASANPKDVFCPKSYFSQILADAWSWTEKQKAHDLQLQMGTARMKAIAAGCAPDLTDTERVQLAFGYVALGQWQEALPYFEFFGQRVIDMSGSGPWGKYPEPFLPTLYAQKCRERLGLSPKAATNTFNSGPAIVSLKQPFVFLPESDQVWIASEDEISCVHPGTSSSWKVRVPLKSNSVFTCLAQSESMLWAGTDGDGVVVLNKADRSIRVITEKDGLLLNNLSALHFHKDRLWVGYGSARSGGLGWLEVNTGKIQSLTPSLPDSEFALRSGVAGKPADATNGPPRGVVTAIAHGKTDELWLSVLSKGVQCFRQDDQSWATFRGSDGAQFIDSLVADESIIAAGSSRRLGGSHERIGGLELFAGPAHDPVFLSATNGLPHHSVTSLALDGETLWIGGRGFMAALDTSSRKVLKTCLVPAQAVKGMVVSGDYVWVQFNNSIYRFQKMVAAKN